MSKEKTFNVPLRKEFRKAPKYKRAKKAVNALKLFLSKHMKSEQIKLSSSINLKLWERGIKNPPHHLKVTAEKDDEGVVRAELFGVKKEKKTGDKAKDKKDEKEVKKEEKEEAAKTKKDVKKTALKKTQSSKAASVSKTKSAEKKTSSKK